jgi:hypothetical protein
MPAKAKAAKLIIVGGGKGGVGKSHVAQCVSAVIVGSKATPPLIVEFEAAKRQGEYYKDRSFYVSVSNTEAEELRRRPALAQQMFDPGFKAIREARIRGQHVVLDLAANLDFTVADYFTALMGESDLGEGDEVVYLAVATAETPRAAGCRAGPQNDKEGAAELDGDCGGERLATEHSLRTWQREVHCVLASRCSGGCC